MSETALILIGIAVVVVLIAAAAVFAVQRGRRRRYASRYGSEYDRAVDRAGTTGRAVEEVSRRERRARDLESDRLTAVEVDGFRKQWREVQKEFVERPRRAVAKADELVVDLLKARGYPVEDELQRRVNLNVVRPELLAEYRSARELAALDAETGSDTEALRNAMVHYRNLVGALLEDGRRH